MSTEPKITKKQIASIHRSAERAREGPGLYIRVAESRIYDGKPLYKALLKEVIYLRMTDIVEGDMRIPKGTPWSKDHTQYEGWCYASQEYLANRVGCVRETANRKLKKIAKDGYLKARKYRGRDGAWHKQYFPDEAFIDAKIAELGSVSEDAHHTHTIPTHDAHVPHSESLVSNGHKPMCPTATSPRVQRPQALVTNKPEPSDQRSQQGVVVGVSECGLEVRSSSMPKPSASLDEKTLASLSENQKTKPKTETSTPKPTQSYLAKWLDEEEREELESFTTVGRGFDVTEAD